MRWLHRNVTRLAVVAGIVAFPAAAIAQDSLRIVDVRRAQATRPELIEALGTIDQVVKSPGYSSAIRKAKEAEAAMVRQRLEEGDFQTGDQIDVVVVNEKELTGKFTVMQDRTLTFPQLPPIPMKGILRSEVRDYLSREIGQYVKNPQVTIQGSYIRLSILGGVSKPGFYTLPSDQLVSDAIMAAGGPIGTFEIKKTIVRRNGKDVVPRGEIERAVQEGRSLDQLNLHGGDELVVAGSVNSGNGQQNGRSVMSWLWPLQGLVSAVLLLTRIL